MDWLAVQPYYKVVRKVEGLEQITYEDHRKMYLSRESIVTHYRSFPVKDVFDLSYKPMGGSGGILYLHTKLGVFSYLVKECPEEFILAFKTRHT